MRKNEQCEASAEGRGQPSKENARVARSGREAAAESASVVKERGEGEERVREGCEEQGRR